MTIARVVPHPPGWHRALRSIGVTGTNGKTTTTTWLSAALATLSTPVIRATTVGYFIGDEAREVEATFDGFLSFLRDGVRSGARFAALEMTSEALARGFALAWPCEIAVFTNLTHDHLDTHGSAEHYLASKAQLFLHLPPGGAAILNASDPASELLSEVIPAQEPPVRVLRYAGARRGTYEGTAPLDARATKIAVTWDGTTIDVDGALPDLPASLFVRGLGDIYAENALAALLGAVAAGADARRAAEGIAQAAAPRGRFEVVHRRPYVVVDYAHSPDALARTLAVARGLLDRSPGKLTAVFGAGGDRDVSKRGEMGAVARVADRVILTSDNPRSESPADIARAIAAGLAHHPNVQTILDRAGAIAAALRDAALDDVVVVAGKGHETAQSTGHATTTFSDHEVIARIIAGRV